MKQVSITEFRKNLNYFINYCKEEPVQIIRNSKKEMEEGNCVSFDSPEKFMEHLEE